MSGVTQNLWTLGANPTPTSEINANGVWKLANPGPTTGSMVFSMAQAGDSCTVSGQDATGTALGDSMSVSGTTKVALTSAGQTGAFYLFGDIYISVSSLSAAGVLHAAVVS